MHLQRQIRLLWIYPLIIPHSFANKTPPFAIENFAAVVIEERIK